jgi:hypothetical protein
MKKEKGKKKKEMYKGKKEKQSPEIKGEGGVKWCQVKNGTHGLFKPDVQAPERV